MSDPQTYTFWQLVRADIEATQSPYFRLFGPYKFWTRALAKLAFSPNVRVVIMYRIAHELAKRSRWQWLALLIRSRGIKVSGCEINPFAVIGPGLYVVHSPGVGIGAYVTIGANCRLHLGSVVGPPRIDKGMGQPTVIGDNVFIGTHAVVPGGITVGDGAVIGANVVVMRDVEPHTILSVSPPKQVGQRSPDDPPAA
jgi:serine O-acetyltransferase